MSEAQQTTIFGRDVNAVKQGTNDCFKELFHQNPGEECWVPFVCLTCDEMIKPCDAQWISNKMIKKNKEHLKEQECARVNNVTLRENYQYPKNKKGYKSFMEDLLLSPKAEYRADKNSAMLQKLPFKACQNEYALHGNKQQQF